MCFCFISESVCTMKDMRGLFLVSLVVGLGLGLESRANAIPTVNIDDATGPITVTGTGFTSFSSGTIAGNSEAVWWCGTGVNLGWGTKAGIWTEPGSSAVSDEFYIVDLGSVAYGRSEEHTSELQSHVNL